MMSEHNGEATRTDLTKKKPFKNRSERNEGVTTIASFLFKGKQILTQRPEGMTKEEFKFLSRHQKAVIKRALR
jgi:hypothetical protein